MNDSLGSQRLAEPQSTWGSSGLRTDRNSLEASESADSAGLCPNQERTRRLPPLRSLEIALRWLCGKPKQH